LPCGSKLGWSVFTGRRTLTLTTPLEVCEHHHGLLAVLNEINGSMRWSNGSQLGKGIYQLLRAAHDMDNDVNIIFISDGHEAPPMERGQRGIQKTDQFTASGILLGVGGESPTPIPKTRQDGHISGVWGADEVVQRPGAASGEELSHRHDAHLNMLANLAGLKYEVLTTDSVLTKAISTRQFSQLHQTDYDLRWIAALSALLILCLRFMPAMDDLRLRSLWR
jgi:mxaL protein